MKHSLRRWLFAAGLSAVAGSALAGAVLRADSFAEAIPLAAEPGYPVQQLPLPDAVYRLAVSPALHDVAVFDAAGTPVPHVLCTLAAQVSSSEARFALPVFPVRLARRSGQGATAEVRTDNGNRIAITVPGGDSTAPAVAVTAYDLDLSAITEAAVALHLQWHSPTGLSEVHVRVEQADASQHWQPVVADAVLKRVSAAGQTLETAEIALPAARYHSLRLTPRDADGTVIDAVQLRTRASSSRPAALRWFTATPTASPNEEMASSPPARITRHYDAGHQAPITAARVQLTAPNTRHALRLQSRSHPKAAWQTVWTGEAFYLLTPTGERRNDEIALASNHDRYWQLVADAGGAPIVATLQLGYAPQNLRFVAQGQGPYRLAYGNAGALDQTPPGGCESLLKTLFEPAPKTATAVGSPDPAAALNRNASLIGTATAGSPERLAGAAALLPAEPAGPAWRRWLLWAVLATAVLLLLGMAHKLLAELNPPNP